MLTAAIPVLDFEGAETGVATLEKPVDVRVGPVTADGATLGPEALATFGFFVYRRAAPGAALDVWDDRGKVWNSEDAATEAAPAQLAYQADDAAPWQGMIVAAGQRDAAGNPQFERAVAGYPQYAVRAYFVTAAHGEALLTGPSANVAFAGLADRHLVNLGPGDGEELDSATQARMQLRAPSLQPIGGVRIDRDAPGARVTIENAAGASIVLHSDGRIELIPAPGRHVVVAGDLDAGHITYLPEGSAHRTSLT